MTTCCCDISSSTNRPDALAVGLDDHEQAVEQVGVIRLDVEQLVQPHDG